jgi:glycosyltransferase involved in cell wall biosynthesis
VRRPRVLFVARTRYKLPLAPGIARKFAALEEVLEVHVLGSAARGSAPSNEMFTLVPPRRPHVVDGLAFWLGLPLRVGRLLRSLHPEAVICQTAYEGAAVLAARRLTGVETRVVVEVHADWRTSTRLYGSPARRLLGPLGDALAAAALRRADRVRTVSPFTADLVRELGVEPSPSFPAYMDLEPFVGRAPEPLPEHPVALFVGVLEQYKNIDGLASAWRRASKSLHGASLRVVGDGARADIAAALVSDYGVRWDRKLSSAEVAQALDDAWVLVLPSRSEGMGRVLVEAFCRGRGVIGTRAGSIPDLVEDDCSGILVDPSDPDDLAAALVQVLSDRGLAARLGERARLRAERWLQTPEEYAQHVRELVAA